jgi:hypothetical protein
MPGKRNTVAVTEQEVRSAIVKFERAGGHIAHMPDQPTPRIRTVTVKSGLYDPLYESGPYWGGVTTAFLPSQAA